MFFFNTTTIRHFFLFFLFDSKKHEDMSSVCVQTGSFLLAALATCHVRRLTLNITSNWRADSCPELNTRWMTWLGHPHRLLLLPLEKETTVKDLIGSLVTPLICSFGSFWLLARFFEDGRKFPLSLLSVYRLYGKCVLEFWKKSLCPFACRSSSSSNTTSSLAKQQQKSSFARSLILHFCSCNLWLLTMNLSPFPFSSGYELLLKTLPLATDHVDLCRGVAGYHLITWTTGTLFSRLLFPLIHHFFNLSRS